MVYLLNWQKVLEVWFTSPTYLGPSVSTILLSTRESVSKLEVVILGIDQEARKLSLGHKQIEEDPWDTFESVFPKGSEHQGTIIKRDDKGGIVALPYGLEAFAPNKHLRKEDGTYAQLDETITFRIREFDRNDKRIIVSHSDSWKVKKEEQFEQERRQKQNERKQTSERVRKVNKQTDRTTLGDLSVLSELKKQMEQSEDDNK